MHKQTTLPCRKSAALFRLTRSCKFIVGLTTLVAMGLAIGTPAAHADYKYYDNVVNWISGGVSGTDLSDYSGFDGTSTDSITINSLTFGGNGFAANSDSNININSFNNLTITSGVITVATSDENNGKYQRIYGGGITTNASNLIINQNGTGGHLEIGSSIFGNMSFTKNGVGFVDLTNYQAAYTGATTINGGTLQLSGSDNLLPTGTAVTINSGTLSLNGHNQTVAGLVGTSSAVIDHAGAGANTLTVNLLSGSNTYGGVIQNSTGTLALILSGSGTLKLTSANTYTGGTTITGGSLSISNDNQLGVSGSTYGSVVLNGGVLFANSSLTINSSRALKIGPVSGTSGGTGILNAALGQTLTYNGTIVTAGNSGTNNLIKSGAGTVILGGSNKYNGITTVNGGVLSVSTLLESGFNGIGISSTAASNLVLDGGTLQYTGAKVTTNRLFTLGPSGGGVDASGSGSLTFGNINSISINSGTSLTLSGTNMGANTFNPMLSNNAGTTSLIKSGVGTWNITNGLNNYSGVTTLNGGTLSFTSGSLGSGSITFGGGTLQYSSGNFQDISSRMANSSGAISIDTNGNSVAFGNNIGSTNTGGLIKTGGGDLTLNTPNSYSGGTTVNSGTLITTTNGDIGSGALAVNNTNATSNATNVVIDFNSTSGTNHAVSSLSSVVSGTGGNTAQIKLETGNTLTDTQSGTTNYAGSVSGSGTLNINGQGTGTNSAMVNYTGTDSAAQTNVGSNATLALQNPSQAALTGPVAVATGGTLQTNANNQLATATNGNVAPTNVALSGGAINANGKSDGAISGSISATDPTTSAVTSHLGTLTLATGTTSTFDFGLNSSNIWAFADSSTTLGSGNLNVLNYVGGQNALYIGTTKSLNQSQLNQIAYNGVYGAFSQLNNGQIILAATPEPSGMVTGLVGVGVLGGVIVFRRRRAGRKMTANG